MGRQAQAAGMRCDYNCKCSLKTRLNTFLKANLLLDSVHFSCIYKHLKKNEMKTEGESPTKALSLSSGNTSLLVLPGVRLRNNIMLNYREYLRMIGFTS